MKVIGVSKRLIAYTLGAIIAIVSIGGFVMYSPPAAASQPNLSLPTVTITVGQPPRPLLPSVTLLPRVTVTSLVTLPRATRYVTLPPSTVTNRVNSVKTVTQRVGVQMPAVTRTVTRYATLVEQAPVKTVTEQVRTTQTVRVTETRGILEQIQLPGKTITLTKTQTFALSGLLIFLGAVAGILLFWAAFAYGFVRGDDGNRKFIREIRDDIKYDK